MKIWDDLPLSLKQNHLSWVGCSSIFENMSQILCGFTYTTSVTSCNPRLIQGYVRSSVAGLLVLHVCENNSL